MEKVKYEGLGSTETEWRALPYRDARKLRCQSLELTFVLEVGTVHFVNKCTSLGLILTCVCITAIKFRMNGCSSLMLRIISVSVFRRCIQSFSTKSSFFITFIAQYALQPYLARITYINTSFSYTAGNGITFLPVRF